jgi:hypothetical protein
VITARSERRLLWLAGCAVAFVAACTASPVTLTSDAGGGAGTAAVGDSGDVTPPPPGCGAFEPCAVELDAAPIGIPTFEGGISLPGFPGGPDDEGGGGGLSCVTSVDCSGGEVCGFDPNGGCNAPGACVPQTAGPAGPPACGCDGTPVQYVASGYTSAPVASPYPCGSDGGDGDAAADARADAGDAADD